MGAANALRIARKPRASGGEATSLPFGSSLNIPEAPTKAQMDQHSYHEDVPLSQARATQSTMDWRAKGDRKNPGPLIGGYEHKPVAVKKENGEYLVYDGHHRSAAAMNDGKKTIGMHVINAKDYDPSNAGRPPMRQGMSDDDLLKELGHKSGGRIGRAEGGSVTEKLHVGPIHSPVAGRTDHLPMAVHSGSYVIPADVVGGMGEGNTIAGFKHIRRVFSGTPYGGGDTPYGGKGGPYNEPLPRANGGATGSVPIVAAGGEYVLSPADVRMAGDGDMDLGHKVLDEFVKRMRKEVIKTMSKLPGPSK